MKYKAVIEKVYQGDLSKVPQRLLCLDPGETTGWCLFEQGKLTKWGQIETVLANGQLNWPILTELFFDTVPTHVVCENYRVYSHKLDRHSFSEVPTLRIIGGIDYLCMMWVDDDMKPARIPIAYQMAVQAKGFATDDRLKDWDFWQPNMKHARDAIRHGIYYLIITNRPKGDI